MGASSERSWRKEKKQWLQEGSLKLMLATLTKQVNLTSIELTKIAVGFLSNLKLL